MHFNIIFLVTPASSKRSLPLRFRNRSLIILVSPDRVNCANCKEGAVLYWAAQAMQISAVEHLLALCSVAFTPDVLAARYVHILPPELSLGLGHLTPLQNTILQTALLCVLITLHSCREKLKYEEISAGLVIGEPVIHLLIGVWLSGWIFFWGGGGFRIILCVWFILG
jgi:glucose-6-phosphate-specific signal transduction histidine kinase